jgi:hypothetical protein
MMVTMHPSMPVLLDVRSLFVGMALLGRISPRTRKAMSLATTAMISTATLVSLFVV